MREVKTNELVILVYYSLGIIAVNLSYDFIRGDLLSLLSFSWSWFFRYAPIFLILLWSIYSSYFNKNKNHKIKPLSIFLSISIGLGIGLFLGWMTLR